MREKGQTEVAKTLETPVFSRGIEILTEKFQLVDFVPVLSVRIFRCRYPQRNTQIEMEARYA